MFGIGGGELIFILFIILMLFGSDKVPEMARTMGKAMAQLKNATNDIKSEIQKGAESNGFGRLSAEAGYWLQVWFVAPRHTLVSPAISFSALPPSSGKSTYQSCGLFSWWPDPALLSNWLNC